MIFDPQLALFPRGTRRNPGPRPGKVTVVPKDVGTLEPTLTSAQIRACNKLAAYYEPEAEPRPKLTKAERIAANADVAAFYTELAAYRTRHPEAMGSRTSLRMGSLSR